MAGVAGPRGTPVMCRYRGSGPGDVPLPGFASPRPAPVMGHHRGSRPLRTRRPGRGPAAHTASHLADQETDGLSRDAPLSVAGPECPRWTLMALATRGAVDGEAGRVG